MLKRDENNVSPLPGDRRNAQTTPFTSATAPGTPSSDTFISSHSLLRHEIKVWTRDLLVFWYPLDRSKSFIKRVVGLPGETVEIRHGALYVNGVPIPEPYVPPQYADVSDFGPLTVARGSYFVMGDHRISSNDSRVFGAVSSQYIYGRAVFAYWPVDHFGSLSTTEANEK